MEKKWRTELKVDCGFTDLKLFGRLGHEYVNVMIEHKSEISAVARLTFGLHISCLKSGIM